MELIQGMATQWGPFALVALAFWKLDRRIVRLEVVLERLAKVGEKKREKEEQQEENQ